MKPAPTVALALIAAFLAAVVPCRAFAETPTDRAADQIFHPYGEPPAAAPDASSAASPIDEEHENVLADSRGPRRLRSMGISGMEGGASIAAMGGLLLVLSLFMDEGTRGERVMYWGGIGTASVGGAVLVTGGILLGIDALTEPAPIPGSKRAAARGGQLTLAFRF